MESDADSPVNQLIDAVTNQKVETSLLLLEGAGGSCRARDLAESAKRTSAGLWSPFHVEYSVVVDKTSGKETLMLYRQSNNHGWPTYPVAGLTQAECKR
jgi:hypothetical protein